MSGSHRERTESRLRKRKRRAARRRRQSASAQTVARPEAFVILGG